MFGSICGIETWGIDNRIGREWGNQRDTGAAGTGVTDSGLSVPSEDAVAIEDQTIYVVKVTGGTDMDPSDGLTPGLVPVQNSGSIHAVATADMINSGLVNVTPITDIVYRLLGEPGGQTKMSSVEYLLEMQRLSGVLLNKVQSTDFMANGQLIPSGDLNGDGAVSYEDILFFNPKNIEHKNALMFDFYRLHQPVDSDVSSQTLIDKYHAGHADIGLSVRMILNTLSYQKEHVQGATSLKINLMVTVAGHGKVTSSDLVSPVTGVDGDILIQKLRSTKETSTFIAENDDPDFIFDSWVGCSSVEGLVCKVSLADNAHVSARFRFKANVVRSDVVSLDIVSQEQGKTGISFKDNKVTFVTRDATLSAKLRSTQIGAVFATGNLDHGLIKISTIVGRSTDANGVMTAVFTFTNTSPLDVYDKISAYSDGKPMSLDNVRSINVPVGAKDVNGNPVKLPTLPGAPDYSSTVTDGGTSTPKAWYITHESAGDTLCHWYGTPAATVALSDAWNTNPRTYPFNQSALSICTQASAGSTINNFPTDHDDAIRIGGVIDLMSGGINGNTLIATNAFGPGTWGMGMFASAGGGKSTTKSLEKVWILGHGTAFDLGEGKYLTNRSDGMPGMQLLVMSNVKNVTTRSAYQQAQKDCALHGQAESCAFVQSMDLDGRGLKQAAIIPFFETPLKVELSKEVEIKGKTATITGSVEFGLNLDLTTQAGFFWSTTGPEWDFTGPGSITMDPNVKVSVSLGKDYGEEFKKKKASDWAKKFMKKDFKKSLGVAETEVQLLSINMAKLLGPAGAVVAVTFDVAVGVDLSGNIKFTINPGFYHKTQWSGRLAHVCKWGFWRNDCTNYNSGNVSIANTPYLKSSLTVEGEIKPYAKVGVSLGINEIAEKLAQIYGKPYTVLNGSLDGGFTWSKGGFCLNGNVSAYAGYGVDGGLQITSKYLPKFVQKILPSWDLEFTFFNWETKMWEYPKEQPETIPVCNSYADLEPPAPPNCQKIGDDLYYTMYTLEDRRAVRNRRGVKLGPIKENVIYSIVKMVDNDRSNQACVGDWKSPS